LFVDDLPILLPVELVSDASSFITGVALLVDGGVSITRT
jgi:hypothetical protein